MLEANHQARDGTNNEPAQSPRHRSGWIGLHGRKRLGPCETGRPHGQEKQKCRLLGRAIDRHDTGGRVLAGVIPLVDAKVLERLVVQGGVAGSHGSRLQG